MTEVLISLLSGMSPLTTVQLNDLLSYLLSTGLPALLCMSVLRKAGFSLWWTLAACIPYLNVVLLLLFALVRWPAHPPASR